ncbi:MAG: Hpt domain-containing protein [Luteibacter sp.]
MHALRRLGRRFARARPVDGLPTLLALLGRRHVPLARATKTSLELDIDPVLAPDLDTDFAVLGDVLTTLLERAIDTATGGSVALQVDVVGETADSQTVHLTVADNGPAADPLHETFRNVSARLATLGGRLDVESGNDAGTHAIVELTFAVPRRLPRVDVDALRRTLGGQVALSQVITALDEALTRDLGRLEQLLAERDSEALQAWLHRVSGVLGMAEATSLAHAGLLLERDLAEGRGPALDDAIRGFGQDAAGVLTVLRDHLETDGI